MRRTGFAGSSAVRDGGIVVGNRSGKDMSQPQEARLGLSHTIIDGNFISFTHNGVAISDYARKTVLTNNQFQEVDREILDWGARTIGRSNKAATVAEEGEITARLDDLNGQRELATVQRPAFPSLTSSAAVLRLTPDVHDLHTLVSQLAYAYYRAVDSETAEASCQANLRKLWTLIEQYETRHGALPPATFFPERPLLDDDSLLVLLGEAARALLRCPTVGEDLQRIGLHYVWNQQLSGKKLSEITAPSNTWVMADFVIAHDWMTKNRFCGHRGGVNILYADGSVKRTAPFDKAEWEEWLRKW
jgi:prepilin-type processing-associated H-X9-DG protein